MGDEAVYLMAEGKQRARKTLQTRYNFQGHNSVTYFFQLGQTSYHF
jgi:hypothetical protein